MRRRGAVPFGYAVDPDDPRQLVEDGHEMCVIADILGRRAGGDSIREIVGDMKSLGVHSRAGRPLGVTQVARILARYIRDTDTVSQ